MDMGLDMDIIGFGLGMLIGGGLDMLSGSGPGVSERGGVGVIEEGGVGFDDVLYSSGGPGELLGLE